MSRIRRRSRSAIESLRPAPRARFDRICAILNEFDFDPWPRKVCDAAQELRSAFRWGMILSQWGKPKDDFYFDLERESRPVQEAVMEYLFPEIQEAPVEPPPPWDDTSREVL